MIDPRSQTRAGQRLKLCVAALLGMCAMLTTAAPAAAADGWLGAGVLAGGKGFAMTPMGQVAYRDVGPRDAKVPLLLIHQAWMSMIEYAQIQDELAKLGYRSIAIDTPGYGMSDPASGQPTIEGLAENLVPVLDDLKIKKVILVGHHTGSLIAADFAAHHPDRAVAVILHGNPFFTKQEAAAALAQPDYDRTPKADGSNFSKFFSYPVAGDPDTPENLRSRTWMLLSMYMMGPDIGHWAVYHYDGDADIRAIKAPTLILTDAHDGIHYMDDRLAKQRPDFKYEVFSNYTGVQMMNEPRRWAEMVGTYIARLRNDGDFFRFLLVTTSASRHLVAPELLSFLDSFPELFLSMDSLEAVRVIARQPTPFTLNSEVAVETSRSVAPGRKGAPDVAMLIHKPEGVEAPLPCIVHMHCGGYVFGSPEADAPQHSRLAAQLRFCIVSVDYRPAPETPFPGAIEDCYAALTWLMATADALKIEASKVGVMGESAGGELAAALALMTRDRGEFSLAFQHLIYPMIDDRTCIAAEPHGYAGEFIWTSHDNRFGGSALLGGELGGDDVSPYAAAARSEDLSGLPRTFISAGVLDLFLEEDIEYARRLMRAGVAVELHVYPGGFHALDYDPSASVAAQARRDSEVALARALHRHKA